jgi:hypothetical protein
MQSKHSNGKVQDQLHACRLRTAATPMCGVDNVINRPSRHIYKQGMGQRRLGGRHDATGVAATPTPHVAALARVHTFAYPTERGQPYLP